MSNRAFDTLERFIKHLPLNGTDRVVVVLKGHLLVEELLREYVNNHFENAEILKDARLTFHQYLCLSRGFSVDESNEKLWTSIEKLNTLRNKLAHSLEPKDIETKCQEFVELLSSFAPNTEYLDSDKNFGALSCCILAICSSLSVALDGKTCKPNNRSFSS